MDFMARRRALMTLTGRGIALGDMPQGTLIRIEASGEAPNFIHIGNDIIASGKTSLIRQYCAASVQYNTDQSNALYSNSGVDAWCCTTYYNSLPAAIQTLLGNDSITADYTFSKLTRKVYVLRPTELGFLNTSEKRIAYREPSSSTALKWWAGRFGMASGSKYIQYISGDGTDGYTLPTGTLWTRPSFSLSSATPIDPTPNTDGSYNIIL